MVSCHLIVDYKYTSMSSLSGRFTLSFPPPFTASSPFFSLLLYITHILSLWLNCRNKKIIPAPNDVGALANRINKATHSAHNKINNLISMKMVFALRDPRIYRQGIQSFLPRLQDLRRVLAGGNEQVY